jgi:hypothetical protein
LCVCVYVHLYIIFDYQHHTHTHTPQVRKYTKQHELDELHMRKQQEKMIDLDAEVRKLRDITQHGDKSAHLSAQHAHMITMQKDLEHSVALRMREREASGKMVERWKLKAQQYAESGE